MAYPLPHPRGYRQIGGRNGFTLLELLVVVAIIGLVVSLITPRFSDLVGKSKDKIVRAQFELFDKALEQYHLDVGNYPDTTQGLGALVNRPNGVSRWNGPYLKKAIPADPWGNNYVYHFNSADTGFEIICYGSDGKPEGAGEASDILHKSK